MNTCINASCILSTENNSGEAETNQDGPVFIIRRYSLPVICFLGLIGNTLSAKAFLGPGLNHASCSFYLAIRSLSDNFFILTLFIAWLDFVHVRIFHTDGICQMVVFLSYTCSFISIWCVVFVTLENYIRLCHHTHVARICNSTVSRFVTLSCFIMALVIYNFPLWGTQVQNHKGVRYCLTKELFIEYEEVITYIDTVLTLIVPLLLILILMTLILINSVDAGRRQRRLLKIQVANNVRRRILPHTKVTKLLSSVTVMFLILHTPSHVIRIKVLFEHLLHGTNNKTTGTDTDRTLQHVFIIMYYLNFSVNCIVYLVCGKNFRKVFNKSFCGCCRCANDENDNEILSNGGMTSSLIVEKEEEETTIN